MAQFPLSDMHPDASECILIIDDDEAIRTLLRIMLSHAGYAVLDASSGQEAIETFQRAQPTLVLLDLRMPGMDGFEICEQLRALPGGSLTPIIVITALNDNTSLRRAFDAGATDYLAKPVDQAVLKIRVQHALHTRRAEEATRRTEARYRSVFEATRDALFIVDLDTTVIIDANPMASEMYGYPRQELIGLPVTQLSAEPERSLTSLREQEVYVPLRYHRRQDGTTFPAMITYSYFEQYGQHMAAIAVHDITLRMQTEAALRENDRRYRALIEQAADGIFVADPEGHYLDANPRGCAMLGYTLDELLNFNIADLVSVEERSHDPLRLNEMRAGKTVVSERTLMCKDGSWLPVEISGKMLVDGRFQGIVRDITERKQAEQERTLYVEQIRRLNLELEARVRQRTAELEHANQELKLDIQERQRVEEALRALSTRQETLLAAIPEIVMEVNSQLVYTWGNAAGLQFFGAEVIGRESAFYFDGEQDIYQAVQPLLRGDDQTIYVESWQRRWDGAKRLLAWQCRSLKDSQGQVIGLLSSANDITERKRAEEALAHLAAIVSSSDDAIIGKTLDGIVTTWNAGAEWMYGYTSAEMVGQAIAVLVPPDAENDVPSIIERVKHGERILHYETVRATKAGRRLHVSLTISPIHDKAGALIGISTVARDITERKRAELELRQSEERFRLLFEQAAVGVALLETETGRYIRVNQKYCDFLGYTAEEMLQKRFQDVGVSEDTNANLNRNAQLITGEINAFSMEKRYYRKDGTVVWGNLSASPLWRLGEKPDTHIHIAVVEDITERKQAETALRASEDKYRQLVGSIEGIVWEFDLQTRQYSYVSPQAERILGYPIAQWLTQSTFWRDHLHPDDLEEYLGSTRNLRMAGREHSFEYRIFAADGRLLWLHDAVKVVKDQDDRPAYLRGIMIDITERKQLAGRLEQMRRQMELIFNAAGEGIFGLDQAGCVTFANAATARLVGRSPDDMLGHAYHSLFHAWHADGSPYPLDDCPIYSSYHHGQVQRVADEVFWREDGSSFPVEYVSTPILESGELRGAVVVFQDITERQQVQRVLEASEQQFRQIMETVPVISAVLDAHGNILFSNEYLSRLTGWPREELVNRNIFDTFMLPEYRAQRKQTLTDYLAQTMTPTGLNFEEEILTRSGARRLTAWKVSFIREPRDHTLRCMALGEDVTEQRKAEQHAVQADRLAALGRLAAALAHEINNPLQAIQSHLELVLDFPLPEEERLEYLKVVRQQIGRLNDITRNVLNFARPTPAPRSLILVHELIEQTLQLARKQLEHHHIQVTKDSAPTCYVLAAPEQLVQVFLNLTINAIEAIQHDGHLHIASRCKEDQIRITFADDGPAIAPQDLPHIFEPFYTTKADGTGLGLSVSHSLIQQHGGQLEAENITPERGVVFTVTLPLISSLEPADAR